MDDAYALARTLALAADEVDRRLLPFAGIMRQAARWIVTAADESSPEPSRPDGCQTCGAPLEQKPTGRPRKFCSDRCRRTRGNRR